MRDVATRSDNDSPTRQSQISVIRSVLGQQFVFPEDMAADDDDIDALPTVTQEVYGTVHNCQCYNYGYNYCDEHSHHNIYNFIKRHHHNDNINNTNSNNNYYYHVISVAVDNHIYVYNY
ncbi:hypothetical protein GGI04_003216 [Coemansia thaxteri]|nr:hypothetical protein GGI04_003216 [Coemansia thaxteri]KAJ2470869.1 hypothetical protein GGI02_002647 [Coemansia sp. RSA 2322]